MKLRLPLQPHICMNDCKMAMGKDRGKLFRLSLGVGAKLEFSQASCDQTRDRARSLHQGCARTFVHNLTTNSINVTTASLCFHTTL